MATQNVERLTSAMRIFKSTLCHTIHLKFHTQSYDLSNLQMTPNQLQQRTNEVLQQSILDQKHLNDNNEVE